MFTNSEKQLLRLLNIDPATVWDVARRSDREFDVGFAYNQVERGALVNGVWDNNVVVKRDWVSRAWMPLLLLSHFYHSSNAEAREIELATAGFVIEDWSFVRDADTNAIWETFAVYASKLQKLPPHKRALIAQPDAPKEG